MKFQDYININCAYCNKSIAQCNSKLDDCFYNCKCSNLSFNIFFRNGEKDTYSFRMNFPENYQIQIHSQIYDKPIIFCFYSLFSKPTQLLKLDFIPELNWKNPLKQLLSLIAFQ